jgi:hypothetical protein
VLTRTGGGIRFGGAGGGGSVGGMAAGMLPVTVASSGISISGGGGNSGCTVATLGRAAGAGGTKTLGGVDFWNQHEVLPNDNARMKGSSRDLAMVYRRRELEAEGSSPAQLACKVDSTIM